MKKIVLFLFLIISARDSFTQPITAYNKQDIMIPMRDGVKLHTVIFTPKENTAPLPILIQRTPYGASVSEDYNILNVPFFSNLAKEGYIFIFQDIRGKYKSEGTMQIHQPITHLKQKGSIDESTDTWDAVDWLVKNLPNNNNKVGILGISYPGWLALVGAIDPHPSLCLLYT